MDTKTKSYTDCNIEIGYNLCNLNSSLYRVWFNVAMWPKLSDFDRKANNYCSVNIFIFIINIIIFYFCQKRVFGLSPKQFYLTHIKDKLYILFLLLFNFQQIVYIKIIYTSGSLSYLLIYNLSTRWALLDYLH